MSKPIRFDPPLVRALAGELHARLAGRGAHPAPLFDRDRSATLLLDRGEALRWELHPERGWLSIGPRPEALADRRADARITRVSAPADERLIRIDLSEGSRFRGAERALVVELHTNQWNALLVDRGTRQILSVLRAREAGDRVLRPGAIYRPPAGRPRRAPGSPEGAWEAWCAEIGALPADARRQALLGGWAQVSPLNADAILGDAAESDASESLRRAFDRWNVLAAGGENDPGVLVGGDTAQPYPVPLAEFAFERTDSLLAAFTLAAARARAVAEHRDDARLLAGCEARLTLLGRRLESLRAEAAVAAGADEVRGLGDLLLANLERVPPGAARVSLTDFAGTQVEVPLDPALRPHQNADALYERARRMARAEARLPGLIARAERERERWSGAVTAIRGGTIPAWVPAALERGRTPAAGGEPSVRLPYRLYTTSGGLEVRVGRSRTDNDRLTFGHSAPDDVWLHARQVPGSHVVLRWPHAEAPPARDLREAAAIAAWYSRARGSGTVAVDWTRRRYVRKPRGAPAGRVAVMRESTLLVGPAEPRGADPAES